MAAAADVAAVTDEVAETEDSPVEPEVSAPVEDAVAPSGRQPGVRAGAFVVTRPFMGAGLHRATGEVVDASDWRSAERLEDMRYLRPMLFTDPEPVADGQGRFFIDEDALLAFLDLDSSED